MYFFINGALNSQNSGIEHAQIQRAKVFRQYQMPFLLLYTAYNRQMHRWLNRFGLSEKETLTLFDYYQRTQQVLPRIVQPDDVFLADVSTKFLTEENYQNCYLVMQGQNVAGRIHWYGDMGDDLKHVSMVERFDIYGNLYRVDEYDVRGFLSRSQYYTPDNKVYMYVWFDVNEKPVITEVINYNSDGKALVSRWEVIDRAGRQNYYRNFRDVVAKFLDDLNNEYFSVKRPNYFVGDRLEGYEDALMQLSKPAIKIAHLHNSHGGDVHDEMHSLLNNYYEFDLYNNDRYDFYVAATHKQTKDVVKRFALNERVRTIPVGLTTPVKKVGEEKRKPHSVLVTARRAEEKQIEKIVEMVGKAHNQIPDITLDVYGYRDGRNHDAAKKKIDAMIKKYDAKDYVTINDYDPDLDEQRDLHQVYVVFSTMEGFNIALMEAQNHGEVAIANDVNYGPNELVVDGQNGYVVGYDDVQAGADRLVELFSKPSLLNKMSEQAYKLSKRYSAQEIVRAWQDLSNDAQKTWLQTVKHPISMTGLEEVSDVQAALIDQQKQQNGVIKQQQEQQDLDVLNEIEEAKQYDSF